MTLISKIQYKNYEPGEFTDKKERSCEETIHLIENFPWQQQRDHLYILYLFINYYLVARDKLLILSRGNDIFYYGAADNPQQFDKKDITEIIVYGSGGRRLEIDGFIRLEMQSGNTPCIYIPYMVLHKGPLLFKLAACPQKGKFSFFPFIPLSSSAPS